MSYQKWIYKYQYLRAEVDELKEDQSKYAQQFAEDFIMPESGSNGSSEFKLPDEESNEPIVDSPARPIYKALSKKLHPDVGGDVEEFKRIAKLYKSGDTIGLYIAAEYYKIDVSKYLTKELVQSFEDSCALVDKEIYNIKNSLAYQWCTIDESKHDKYIKWLGNNFGILPKKS